MLVAAVGFFFRVQRSAIASVAGRATKLLERMEFEQIGIGMAGEWSVHALGHAQVGFGHRHDDRNDQRVGADVARLAAIHQAYAADIVDLRARRIDVDLPQFDVHALDACAQTREIRGTQTGQVLLDVFVQRGLRFLGRLVHLSALSDQGRALRHDAGERVRQFVGGHLPRR